MAFTHTQAQVVFDNLQLNVDKNMGISTLQFLDKPLSFTGIYSICPVLQNSIFFHLICNINCS